MGAKVNACKVPGSTSSCFDSPRRGCATETVGIPRSAVSCFTIDAALMRELIPRLTTVASNTTSTRIKTHLNTRLPAGDLTRSCSVCIIFKVSTGNPAIPVQEAEHRRYEKQRRYRGEDQPSDHGSSQRRVLLAAFAQA